MGKSVLILTDAFMPPAFVPRVRTLCDVLTEQGWTVKVLTEQVAGINIPFMHDYDIQTVPYYKHQGWWGKLEWGWKFLLGLLYDHKGRYFTHRFNELLQNEHFDCVLCSTFHTFPLTVAERLAKQRKLPLHVDLRDMMEQCAGNEYNHHKGIHWRLLSDWIEKLHRTLSLKRRNRVLSLADSVSSVSPWHVKQLQAFNSRVSLIYNGYDQRAFTPKDVESKAFKIVYTGMIYGKRMQDPTLFFEALQRMCQQDTMPRSLECHFYVKPATQIQLKTYAEDYGVADYVYCHDYVAPEKIPHLLQDSSIVLVLSNKTTSQGPHGVMTTKFYEALGVEKPVLCVRSDEDCLADVIRTTQAGLAATEVEQVQQFIQEKHREWMCCAYTHQQVNKEEKEKYCRQNQAKQFMDSLLNIQKR